MTAVAALTFLFSAGEILASLSPQPDPSNFSSSLSGSTTLVTKVLRQRHVKGGPRRGAHELKDGWRWPNEPVSPITPVDGARFGAALTELCRPVARNADLASLPELFLTTAAQNHIDPFLLGALAFHQSGCRARKTSDAGTGLLQIQPAMFSQMPPASLPFPRSALAPTRLLDPAHNLATGAALLKMWRSEHPRLDQAFPNAAHRTEIAHFVWGDRVWAAHEEDRVLTARRRLIELYSGGVRPAAPSPLGFDIVAPLDGGIRLATSGLGADRDGGKRLHRGLDIDADEGEPVRAIADGVVLFAGVDMPGASKSKPVAPTLARRYLNRRMGAGGLFVRIVHENGFASGYFHLASYNVTPNQMVRAGELIGTVGRTGVKISQSHLHFDVHHNDALLDPVRVLANFVIPPQATISHDVAMAHQKDRLHRQRQARAWRATRKQLTS